MTPEFWAIVALGFVTLSVGLAVEKALKAMLIKLDILIDEVRYPNLEAQKSDLLGR